GVGQVLLVAIARHALHPVEIRTGAERRAVPGKDHHADRFVRGNFLEYPGQSFDQFIVESIAQLRPVQRDARDAVALDDVQHYMRKTPNRVSSIGALSEAESASPSRRRESAGSTTPSSHRRALA